MNITTQSAGVAGSQPDAPLRELISGLAGRNAKLSRMARYCIVSGALLVALASALAWYSADVAPSAQGIEIHIPESALNQLERSYTLPESHPIMAGRDMLIPFMTMILTLLGTYLVIRGLLDLRQSFLGIEGHSKFIAFFGIFGGAGVITFVSAINMFPGDTSPLARHKDTIITMIKAGEIPALQRMLVLHNVAEHEQTYLLTQAAVSAWLSGGREAPGEALQAKARRFSAVVAEASAFEPDGRAVYAVEAAVFGEPQSPIAADYQRRAEDASKGAFRAALVLFFTAVGLLLTASGFYAVIRRMTARIAWLRSVDSKKNQIPIP